MFNKEKHLKASSPNTNFAKNVDNSTLCGRQAVRGGTGQHRFLKKSDRYSSILSESRKKGVFSILIVHVGHVRQSSHINVSLIHVPRSASVHIMAVDTHTTVPKSCGQQEGYLLSTHAQKVVIMAPATTTGITAGGVLLRGQR